MATSLDGAGANLDFGIGPVDGVINAQTLLLSSQASIGFEDSANPFDERVTVAASGTLDLDFDFDASLYGNALVDPSQAGELPSFAAIDGNLFDNTAPQFTLDVEPLVMSLTAQHVIDGLRSLADWVDEAAAGEALDVTIPLINQTVAELLSANTKPRRFGSTNIVAISAGIDDGTHWRVTATLDTTTATPASLGIKPGDTVRFLAASGDTLPAQVETLTGGEVTFIYANSSSNQPNVTAPELTFEVSATIGSQLREALSRFSADGAQAPELGDLLAQLADTLGIDFGAIDYDPMTKQMTLTPSFQPAPLLVSTRLDLGEEVSGLGFSASGDFNFSVTPNFRLPLGINLDTDAAIPSTDRLYVREDAEAEVQVQLEAQLDNPQARASIGLLTAVLRESNAIAGNTGIVFDTELSIDIRDPGTGAVAGGATIGELLGLADAAAAFNPSFSGSLDVPGVLIEPEFAGATIPGAIELFTTTDGTTREPAEFTDISQLVTLFDQISIDNTLGDFDSLTADDMVTMFTRLGTAIGNIAGTLDVPDGIPFVDAAISGVVDFAETTREFARQLYFNPRLIAADEIQITDGQLSSDATWMLRIEGGDPIFVILPAASTEDNQSIDDLFTDLQAAIANSDADGLLVAERLQPLAAGQIVSIVDVSGDSLGDSVSPLPTGFARYTVTFDTGIDLFNAGTQVGQMLEYRDLNGQWQRAAIDEMTRQTLSLRFEAASQAAPQVGAERSIALADRALSNHVVLRTSNPSVGISLDASTVMITAADDAPSQLSEDISFAIEIDGTTVPVTLTAAATADAMQPADMVQALNRVLAETDFDDSVKLNAKVRAVLVGDAIRLAAAEGSIQTLALTGAQGLGFAAAQSQDENTAATELGFAAGQLVSARFCAGTIQDLVHTLNGLIEQEFAGSPFQASLGYTETPTRAVTFNFAIAKEFSQSIDLNLGNSLDIGFTDLSIAGGADASFTALAGIELGVGIELDPIGAGMTLTPTRC